MDTSVPTQNVLAPVPGYSISTPYPSDVSASVISFAYNGYTYSCSASSSQNTYGPFNPFADPSWNTWNNNGGYYEGGATYQGTYVGPNSLSDIDGQTISGEWLFFKFPYKVFLTGYVLQGDFDINRGLKDFRIIASNTGTSWTTLDNVVGLDSTYTTSQPNMYSVAFGSNSNPTNQLFSHVGIIITRVCNNSNPPAAGSQIASIQRFYILGQTRFELVTAPSNLKLWFPFENSARNLGADGGTGSMNGPRFSYDISRARVKIGGYSLRIATNPATTNKNYFVYPSSGNYSLDLRSGCAVSFWFRIDSSAVLSDVNNDPTFFSYGDINNTTLFTIYISKSVTQTDLLTSNLVFIFGGNGSGSSTAYQQQLSALAGSPRYLTLDGQRHHIGWSISATGVWTVIINGQNLSTSRTTGNMSSMNLTNPFFIGADSATVVDVCWNGNIDDFRLYNQPLTLLQLKYLYKNQLSP